MKDQLYRMSFSGEELSSVPKVQAGFMVASCLAMNDITIFSRLFLMSLNDQGFHGGKVDDVVAEYALTQTLVIQRTLSGKLKEYLYLCHQYQQKCKMRHGDKMKRFLEKSSNVYLQLKSMPGYELADWYRDKITHHYILSNISELLSDVQDESDYTIYLHEKDGNTGYFLGERVLLHKMGDLSEKRDIDRLNEFQDWVVHAAKVVQALHSEFCEEFLEVFFPQKNAIEFSVEIPENMLAKPGEARFPLFWDFRVVPDAES